MQEKMNTASSYAHSKKIGREPVPRILSKRVGGTNNKEAALRSQTHARDGQENRKKKKKEGNKQAAPYRTGASTT